MEPKANKPSTPSRHSKKDDSDFLEEDECRTAVETESLTDARISRVPATVSPRDAWANVSPSTQPRIVPATNQSQADRDAHEIATSTQRALETLRNSSDPSNRLFVSPYGSNSQITPKRTAKSPFKPFSGQGRPVASPISAVRASSVRTAVAASPAQTSVRTAAARSPDVRTGLEHSARSARLREEQSRSRSRSAAAGRSSSNVHTAVAAATPKKGRSRSKSGCSTLHTATANYEIDLRQRSNSVTNPTTNVSTARTISPARGRSPARPIACPADQRQSDADYPPLPSEGDPTEQTVELADRERAAREYTPHISRPILFGTTSGVRTARAISPARSSRMLSERTARGGDSSLKTSRSPASMSEKSMRTGRTASPANTLGSYKTDHHSISSKKATTTRRPKIRSQKSANSSLCTTSARSFGSKKSWDATAQTTTPRRKNRPRSAHKSASETPASMTARSGCDFSSKSGESRRSGRRTPQLKAKKLSTPLRTAAANDSSARSQRTAISPDVTSAKRTPSRAAGAPVRPLTPDTPAGWPYRASEQIQMRQTAIRIAPSSNSLKTAAKYSSREQQPKSSKTPSLRSQKEGHRDAKKSSASRSRRSNNPTSNVSTARTMASRLPAVSSSNSSSRKSTKELHSSKINARTLSPSTLAAARRTPVDATDDGPDMVIETVQTHGNIEIDLCFNFRVRAPPGKGFGESSSPLKPKEVLINGHPIWKKE